MNGTGTPPNLHDRDSVIAAIDGYFNDCVRSNQMPQNEQLYKRLGISRSQWHHAKNGHSNKISAECVEAIHRACLMLSAYREQLLLSERSPIHPGRLRTWILLYDIGGRQPRRHRTYKRKKEQETQEEQEDIQV